LNHFHRDENLTLNYLLNFYETIGSFEVQLSLVAFKILVRLHNTEALFQYFLTKLAAEDRKIAIFTS